MVITSDVAGHVKNIFFTDGSYVRKDDPLVQLDDSVSRSQLISAQASLAYSEQDLKRKRLLGKRGAIAQQMIDQAAADFKEKQAAMEQAKVAVSKTLLCAPFDGKIGRSSVSPGDYVTIGQKITNLTDVKHLRVEYNLPESSIPHLKLNQVVQVRNNALPKKTFSGSVSYISPTIDVSNRSIELYASLNPSSDVLVPGMFVTVEHTLDDDENILLIPARSLVPILDGEQVFKVIDGKAFATKVIVGRHLQNNVEILQGLSNKDLVITDGQLKITNGSTVKIKS